jgi:hypothetical protein
MSGWTKRQVIEEAFSTIGKGDYAFDMPPEAYQSALRQMDMMLAAWGASLGVRIGYVGGDGFGDIGVETNLPDWSCQAIYLNLALLLAPTYGKTVPQETRAAAKAAYDALLLSTIEISPRYIGGYGGAGNRGRAMPSQSATIATGNDGILEI